MKNIKLDIDNKTNKLTIEIDLKQTFGLSKSGKTIIIGSTNGNITLGRDDIRLGVNCYKDKAPE